MNNVRKGIVPVAMFVGVHDNLSTPVDARWLKRQLGDKVVKYVELESLDHSAFNFGKDMSYID